MGNPITGQRGFTPQSSNRKTDNIRAWANRSSSHHSRRWEKKENRMNRNTDARSRFLHFIATRRLLKQYIKKREHITQTPAIPTWSTHGCPACWRKTQASQKFKRLGMDPTLMKISRCKPERELHQYGRTQAAVDKNRTGTHWHAPFAEPLLLSLYWQLCALTFFTCILVSLFSPSLHYRKW